MAKQLTKRQHTVLETIRSWIHERGYPPTIRELGQQLGIKSLRGVTTHLDAIAKKGFLKRESRARGIRLLDLVAPFEQAIRVPVLERFRSGEPIMAQQQVEEHIIVDGKWAGATPSDASAHFALRVRGESMMSVGILDGDYVIVHQQPAVADGDIVAVLLGDEATVKRFFKENGHVRLQPEHPTMTPIVLTKPNAVTILGKVIAVFRKYKS